MFVMEMDPDVGYMKMGLQSASLIKASLLGNILARPMRLAMFSQYADVCACAVRLVGRHQAPEAVGFPPIEARRPACPN